MDNCNELLEKCVKSIHDLSHTYENNSYMLQRLHNHVVNYLPNTLENELKNHEKRVIRNIYKSIFE